MDSRQPLSAGSITVEPEIIFVTGASRSGTTMLCQVLGNHSKILGLNELHFFGDLWDPGDDTEPLGKRKLESLAAALYARQARGIWGRGTTASDCKRAKIMVEQLRPGECTGAGVFTGVLSQLAAEAGKVIACEQTPRNIYYAERLLSIFPGAYVIHMMRDPRAVLASQKNRWQLRRLGAKNVPFSELLRTWLNYHPVTMCRLWMNASKEALRLTGHPRFMILRFESLVSEPEQYVRNLCDFLGIEFELDMLVVPQWGSSNVGHKLESKGISKETLHQWEGVLSDGELLISEYMTRTLMEHFSYEPKSTGKPRFMALLPYIFRYPVHVLGVILGNPRRAWIQIKAMLHGGRKD